MESTETTIAYVFNFEVYEADDDSFSVGGNRYYVRDHGLKVGDKMKVTITRVKKAQTNDQQSPSA